MNAFLHALYLVWSALPIQVAVGISIISGIMIGASTVGAYYYQKDVTAREAAVNHYYVDQDWSGIHPYKR